MPETKTYHLPPTPLVPNSPRPLIHYRGLLTSKNDLVPTSLHDKLATNGWTTQWIWRYGADQRSHYHSGAHECMVVLTGSARIRFGVADIDDHASESGGLELDAAAGDVFILPAGTAHRTYNTQPEAPLLLLTPGDGHGVSKEELGKVELAGFTMMGAYPEGSEWDYAVGGDSEGRYERVWNVPVPRRDPLLGGGEEGLCKLWLDERHGSKL